MNPLPAFLVCSALYICAVEPKSIAVILSGNPLGEFLRLNASQMKETTNMYLVDLTDPEKPLKEWETSYDFRKWAGRHVEYEIWVINFDDEGKSPAFDQSNSEWRKVTLMDYDYGKFSFMCKEVTPEPSTSPNGTPLPDSPSEGNNNKSSFRQMLTRSGNRVPSIRESDSGKTQDSPMSQTPTINPDSPRELKNDKPGILGLLTRSGKLVDLRTSFTGTSR